MVNLTEENIRHINSLGLKELNHKWRYGDDADPWLQGETGVYWGRRMSAIKRGVVLDPTTAAFRRRMD